MLSLHLVDNEVKNVDELGSEHHVRTHINEPPCFPVLPLRLKSLIVSLFIPRSSGEIQVCFHFIYGGLSNRNGYQKLVLLLLLGTHNETTRNSWRKIIVTVPLKASIRTYLTSLLKATRKNLDMKIIFQQSKGFCVFSNVVKKKLPNNPEERSTNCIPISEKRVSHWQILIPQFRHKGSQL